MGEGCTEQNVNRQKFQKYPLPAAMTFDTPLPIDAVLSELRAALATRASAVLVAPPGAGKTTRVPLALMDESWLKGRKILVLEPRRIAERAAAERMARTVGGRGTDRTARANGLEIRAEDANRGRHRGRFHAHDP